MSPETTAAQETAITGENRTSRGIGMTGDQNGASHHLVVGPNRRIQDMAVAGVEMVITEAEMSSEMTFIDKCQILIKF